MKFAFVVETSGIPNDAQSLYLLETERLAIVAWIAPNPDAGDVIEGYLAGRAKYGSRAGPKGRAGAIA